MKNFKKYYKYILLSILIISILSYLSFKDPIESLSIIISTICMVEIYNLIKKNIKLSLKKTIVIFIFIYCLFFIVLFSNRYQMPTKIYNPNKINNDTAVLLVYSGENTMYSFKKEISNILLRNNKREMIFYPYKLYKVKSIYKKIGKSKYKYETRNIEKNLSLIIKDDYKSYLTYLYDNNYLEKEILKIVKDGYQKIIVVPMFLNDDYNIINLKNRVEKMNLYNFGIEYKYTDTFWESETLIDSYVKNLKVNLNDINKVGINLVGIAKDIKEKNNSNAIKQNILFRNKIKERLVEELGIDSSLVKLSWYNELNPNFISKNTELFEYGISQLIILPTDPELSDLIKYNIHKKTIKDKELPESLKVKVIDGFINDNNIIKEIIKKIEYVDIQNWKN
ncbi:MAG: hypothetical protein ACTH0S_08555 [Senegalia sp. (in: firmicutes)]